MSTEKMFEEMLIRKERFPSPRGMLTVESLFDLPLTSSVGAPCLNDTAKRINRELQKETEEDFVNESTGADKILEMKLELVKYVIDKRKKENQAKLDTKAKAEKKRKLLEALEEVEGKEFSKLSADALRKKIAELD